MAGSTAHSTSNNDQQRSASLLRKYDFVVCGSGPGGSVVARRLAEAPDVTVLLLEAGGRDDSPLVNDATLWMSNLGTERDWCFVGEPLPSLGSRSLSYDMGNVVGGSSGINASVWARGHRVDWEDFREATRDEGWGLRIGPRTLQKSGTLGGAAQPSIPWYRGACLRCAKPGPRRENVFGFKSLRPRRFLKYPVVGVDTAEGLPGL
jgi:choline dehydrogenase-like flavoprotein